MVKNENLDICRECGGMCCKKSGCDYSADDFKNCTYDNLIKELRKGDKSIVCMIKFNVDKDGNNSFEPFFYLRARNIDRDIIDLISIKTRCSLLTDTGCSLDYKHRPMGGRNLKPVRASDGLCRPIIKPLDIVNTWRPYQKILKRIVLNLSGKNFEEKIREDVENLFYDILTENYKDVSVIELKDIKYFAVLLARTFPLELENANKRYESGRTKLLVKVD